MACGGGSTPTSSSSTHSIATATPAGTSVTASNPAPSSSNNGGGTSGGTSAGTSGGTSGGTSATASSPATSNSSIPSNATVLDGLQGTGSWSSCSDCAGGGVTSEFWTTPNQSSPSLSGSSRQFFIAGPGWSDALWINKVGAHNDATHFLWDFYVYFDNDSAANVWSAEYDFWQALGGQKHMIGSQCVFGENHWDLWDSKAVKWVNSGIPCPRFSGGQWHHIAFDVERISSWQYRYNTLWVDDQTIPLGQVFDAEPTDWSDNMGVQWQLDQDSNGTPVNEWVDRVKLTIW